MKPIHILNQMGILASFSVAKKVTDGYIHKYFEKQKKMGKTPAQINEMLHKQILDDIKNALLNNEVPGLVSSQEIAKQLGMDKSLIDRIPEINRLVVLLSQKMAEKKYDKMSLCYFINSLVNIIGLTEQDFEKFHRQNSEDDDGDEGYKEA